MNNPFKILHYCSHSLARAGELATPHGKVPTPAFVPVGSQGTVKSLTPDELKNLSVNMILCNTYHLYLRPGLEVVERHGGLHSFMGWNGPIITDSGGYQAYSLSKLKKVSEEGIYFRSHIDGSEHYLSPHLAMEYQRRLGADLLMALDECPEPDSPFEVILKATERTHRWAEICLKQPLSPGQLLFGIIQGGLDAGLRRYSSSHLSSLEFSGYGIGGLSLGEPKEKTWEMASAAIENLPLAKPRYLMGVGSPEDLVYAVSLGIDLFDSALPTRTARNGALFTPKGRINIRNAEYRNRKEAIWPDCQCYTCQHFSAAYLGHLFRCEELLAYRLATLHNLHFIIKLMEDMRKAILSDEFPSFKHGFLLEYKTTNEDQRIEQKKKWKARASY